MPKRAQLEINTVSHLTGLASQKACEHDAQRFCAMAVRLAGALQKQEKRSRRGRVGHESEEKQELEKKL